MDEFEVIVIMNEATIKFLKDKNRNSESNLVIRKYLQNRSCFFKMDRETAHKILLAVGVNEKEINRVYTKLTSEGMFYDLLNKGLIDVKDEKLVINYAKRGEF